MILIFADHNDLCARQTYEYLKQRGIEVFFIDLMSDFLGTMGVNWLLASRDESFLTVNSRKVPLSEITGVVARTIYPSYADPQLSQKDQDYFRFESHAAFIGLLNFLDCPVINRPTPGMACPPFFANSYQVIEVMRCHFKVPEMLVTSSPKHALSFYDSCNQVSILGSPGSPLLIKGEEGATHLQTILSQQAQPIYLQGVSEGEWFQAFVVGNKVFGASFWFESLAGEKQKMPFQAVELPAKLQEQCCKLAQALKLDFLQVRLLQTEPNEVFCFDVSDFPFYVQCENLLQKEIVTALVDLLEKCDGVSI